MSQRFAVLGAGVIGLLSARELRARGHRVVLVDSALPGRQASWAGGGIVSPLYPWRYPPGVSVLAERAQQAYAQLAASLAAETGIDPEYSPCGLLMLDPPDVDEALDWSQRQQRVVEVCDPAAVAARQPGLCATTGRSLWMPGIGNIRNPRLLKALLAALLADPGVETRWQSAAQLRRDGRRVALQLDGDELACDGVLVAAGAWTASLLAPLGISLPVVPVRGQMLLFPARPGLLRCMVLHDGRYLIPRRDGRILCGSTLEHAGFDNVPTAAARESLLATAQRILPALAGLAPEAHWAGLRPAAPAGIPFIAPLADNLVVNAGHFRNGLVLAPASATLGVDLLEGVAPCIDPAPYALAAARH